MIAGELVLGFIITILFLLLLAAIIYEGIEALKNIGRQCRAVHLEGLSDFEREQKLCLTLDIKNRVILMDGLSELDTPSKHYSLKRINGLKKTQIRLRFQQVTNLKYIDWQGDISRWQPGTSGVSYPGIFKGTRIYYPPTQGYFYTEKLKVTCALEIQYRDQNGFPARIVFKVERFSEFVEKWLETLCRCTGLPAPQYAPPVKPAKPGPKYL